MLSHYWGRRSPTPMVSNNAGHLPNFFSEEAKKIMTQKNPTPTPRGGGGGGSCQPQSRAGNPPGDGQSTPRL